MKTLYLVCGAPFSGKTTLAKQISLKTKSQYLSLDDILRQKGLDLSHVQPVEEWEEAHQRCLQLMNVLMCEKISVVLDDTNFLKMLRDRYRNLASQHTYKVVTIYMDIPLLELEARRKKVLLTEERNFLSDEAFYPAVEQFEIPGESENTIVFDNTSNIDSWINTFIC